MGTSAKDLFVFKVEQEQISERNKKQANIRL
jgi:hypothetical protein